MAKVDLSKLGEILECSVCLEQLDETSKVLPCQHCFCRRCLHNIANTTCQLTCPECRTPVNAAIDELPSNILLVRLLDTLKHIRIEQPAELKGDSTEVVLASSSDGNNNSKAERQLDVAPCANVSEAVALYTYKSEDPNELSFERGERIILLDRVDENWFIGQSPSRSSVRALVPANYIRIMTPDTDDVAALKQAQKASAANGDPTSLKAASKEDSSSKKESVIAQMSPTRKAVALYDFDASNVIISTGISDEYDEFLAFRKGESITLLRRIDTNWFVGTVDAPVGRVGLCPTSYVRIVEEDIGSPTCGQVAPSLDRKDVQLPDFANCSQPDGSTGDEPIYMMPSSISVRPVDDEHDSSDERNDVLGEPRRVINSRLHVESGMPQTGLFSHGAQITKKPVAAGSCCASGSSSRRAHDFECVYSTKNGGTLQQHAQDARQDERATVRKPDMTLSHGQSQPSVRVAFLGGSRNKNFSESKVAAGMQAKESTSKGEQDRPKTPVTFGAAAASALVCPANVTLFGAGKSVLAEISAKLETTPTVRKVADNDSGAKRAADTRLAIHRDRDDTPRASSSDLQAQSRTHALAKREAVDSIDARPCEPETDNDNGRPLTRSETERAMPPGDRDRSSTLAQSRARSAEKQIDVRCVHRSTAACAHRHAQSSKPSGAESCGHAHAHSHATQSAAHLANRLRAQSARERESVPLSAVESGRHARSFTHARSSAAAGTSNGTSNRALSLADGSACMSFSVHDDAASQRRAPRHNGTKSPTAKLWRMLSTGSTRIFESLRTTVKRIGSHHTSMSDAEEDDSFDDAYDDVSVSEDDAPNKRFSSPLNVTSTSASTSALAKQVASSRRRAIAVQRIAMDLEAGDPSRLRSRSRSRFDEIETNQHVGGTNATCQCANCAWKQRESRLALEVAYSPRQSRLRLAPKVTERANSARSSSKSSASTIKPARATEPAPVRRSSNENDARSHTHSQTQRHVRRNGGVSRSAASTPDSSIATPALAPLPSTTARSGQGQSSSMRTATPCCAIRRFAARADDELSVHVGDMVYVIQVRPDGWCEAVNARTNEVGFCPLVFLEPTDSDAVNKF